jgi:hypothetical protein
MNKQTSITARNDFEALQFELDALATDAEKYYHGKNKAAGARLRKGLLQVSRNAHALRQSLSGIDIDKYCNEPDNF